MRFLYNLAIQLYGFIIFCIAPFNSKAKKWYLGRKNFNPIDLKPYKNGILIQASSLGEYEQAKPLIDALRIKFPNKKIVLSFFSPSGYEAKKNLDIVDKVIYLPLDTPKKSQEFVNALEPEFAFFIKYDFWPNMYKALYNSSCKIFLVSTIFREDQAFFKWYGSWYKNTLKYVDFFFVQNKKSQDLLKQIGIENTSITGDTRFDQVLSIKSEPYSNSTIESFIEGTELTVVGGSTWLEDEKLILSCIEQNKDCKWIIAPHETHSKHINTLLKLLEGESAVLYTQNPTKEELSKANILIIDTIGILKHLYRYANISFIGGGFGKGIHNTLEPAVYGIPVLFGPNHKKFQEAQDLLERKLAFEINQENVLESFKHVRKSEKRAQINTKSLEYISEQKGAIDKIIKYLS